MPREVLRIQATKRVVAAEDDFFIYGNFERYKAFFQHAQKRAMHPTSNDRMDDEYDMQSISTNHIVCVEVGCNQMFSSLKKFEEHKFKCHSHQCSVCGKSFAADRLLSLHISELHDSYFAVACKKKPLYCCLVSNCNEQFWSDAERRDHLIQRHLFHPSYDFHNPKKFLKKLKKQAADGVKSPAKQTPVKPPSNQYPKPAPTTTTTTTPPVGAGGGNRAQRRATKFNNPERVGSVHDTSEGDKSSEMELVYSAAQRKHNNDSAPRDQAATDENACDDSMDIELDIDAITNTLQATRIHVPSKISFGRRKGHH